LNQAKPGENIKIADILRKTQNLTDPNLSSNNLLSGDSLLFQNSHINLSMLAPSLSPLQATDHAKLAD